MARKNPKNPLDELKTFYDPHPGFVGAAIPIPEKVKQVADELAGRTMTLREAMRRLKAVKIGIVENKPAHNFISLRLGRTSSHVCHFFRVIKYRSP